jgi:dihydroxyacetone kinase-like predicted kinase
LPEKNKALVGLLGKIKDIKKCETVILFYGKSISEEEANGASEAIKEKYPNLEVGLIPGGQEVYDYLLGVN